MAAQAWEFVEPDILMEAHNVLQLPPHEEWQLLPPDICEAIAAGGTHFWMADTQVELVAENVEDGVNGWLGPHGEEVLIRPAPAALVLQLRARIEGSGHITVEARDLQGDARWIKSFRPSRRVTAGGHQQLMSTQIDLRHNQLVCIISKGALPPQSVPESGHSQHRL